VLNTLARKQNDTRLLKSAIQQYQGQCDLQIAKCARGKESVTDWIQLGSAYQTFKRHDKAIGIVEVGWGVHIVRSLDVRGFWDVTPHTVTQIYRRFG